RYWIGLSGWTRSWYVISCSAGQRWRSCKKFRRQSCGTFFRKHYCRDEELMERRLLAIRQALPAIRNRAVIEVKRMVVRVIVQVIVSLLEGIADLDKKIEEAAAAHPDFFILGSLPGAGAVMAPRLLAAFGSQRERYGSAGEVPTYTGIAPVMEKSGKKKWGHFRWACPKFLRQSFHEWAGHSIAQSVWARSYYQQLRNRGKGHFVDTKWKDCGGRSKKFKNLLDSITQMSCAFVRLRCFEAGRLMAGA